MRPKGGQGTPGGDQREAKGGAREAKRRPKGGQEQAKPKKPKKTAKKHHFFVPFWEPKSIKNDLAFLVDFLISF